MAQMRYAHQPDVLTALRIGESDTAAIDQVVRLENGLAASFDHRCGRVFGETTVPALLRVATGYASDLLLLPAGLASVTSIEIHDPLTGSRRILTDDEWLLWGADAAGNAVGVLRINDTWAGLQVAVTGLWGDQDVEGVPDDVREAMTTLTVKEYRRRTSSPTDTVGPDGMPMITPSGWNDPAVKEAIAAHRIARRGVGV